MAEFPTGGGGGQPAAVAPDLLQTGGFRQISKHIEDGRSQVSLSEKGVINRGKETTGTGDIGMDS